MLDFFDGFGGPAGGCWADAGADTESGRKTSLGGDMGGTAGFAVAGD